MFSSPATVSTRQVAHKNRTTAFNTIVPRKIFKRFLIVNCAKQTSMTWKDSNNSRGLFNLWPSLSHQGDGYQIVFEGLYFYRPMFLRVHVFKDWCNWNSRWVEVPVRDVGIPSQSGRRQWSSNCNSLPNRYAVGRTFIPSGFFCKIARL